MIYDRLINSEIYGNLFIKWIFKNYIHVDQFGVPLENSSHFTDSYGNLNDLNGTIHHGIEFSFDDPPEDPIESELGSVEDDHLGKSSFKRYFWKKIGNIVGVLFKAKN